MKTKSLLLVLGSALFLGSCGENAENEVVEVEAVTYSLNAEESSLKWHGEENADHFHDGTISFTDGSFTMKGEEVVSGEFNINPATLVAMTEGYPVEKMEYLKGHLLDTAFLFTAEYPTIKVTTGEYLDGKLMTTINVRGVEIPNDIPLKIESGEEGVHIWGDFSIDFAAASMPYLVTVNPETGKPGAKSVIDFKMDLKLDK